MRTATAVLVVLACVGMGGCTPPDAPDEERRPAPQAGADADARPRSSVVQAADAYKERARDAGAQQLEAADQQRADIDAQTR